MKKLKESLDKMAELMLAVDTLERINCNTPEIIKAIELQIMIECGNIIGSIEDKDKPYTPPTGQEACDRLAEAFKEPEYDPERNEP